MTVKISTNGYYFAIAKHPDFKYDGVNCKIKGWTVMFTSSQSKSLGVPLEVTMAIVKDDTKIEVKLSNQKDAEILELINKYCS
ncbi:gp684 [Bacillus phage G]|uniref:Gp684 n=1 Tax=Bacillus phage G TaxID=2884420 RepID=G3MB64_9CAUD|nr:gp684 [Bacillus phage G]AEO93927.1 gp684 [Bacillus phage G]